MRTLVLAAAVALAAAPASAGPFPHTALLSLGYAEARPADFAASPGQDARRREPTGYLAVSADFNGDGKLDEARVLLKRATGEAMVVATIESPVKVDTYVLRQLPAAEAARLGIRTVPGPGRPALAIFDLQTGAAAQVLRFDGSEFTEVEPPTAGPGGPP